MTRSRTAFAAFLCIALAAGCTSTPAPNVDAVAQAVPAEARPGSTTAPAGDPAPAAASPRVRLSDHLTLGDAVRVGGLTVWPVLTDAPEDVGEFATLTDAQRRRRAEVRECGVEPAGLSFGQVFRERQAVYEDASRSADKQVGRLVLDNAGDVPLFVPAGTLVRGGDQDRFLAEDLVVPADRAVLARVFCVEADRWTDVRGGQTTAGRFDAAECVAVAGVRTAGQYEDSQPKVWERVAAFNRSSTATRGTAFAGSAAADGSASLFVSVDDANEGARKDRATVAGTVLRHFESLEAGDVHPVGFAYAVGSRPIAVHAFAGPDLFRPRFRAYLEAMAIEAASSSPSQAAGAPAASADDVAAFVRAIGESGRTTVTDRKTHRLVSRTSGAGWSCACVVTLPGRDVTLSQDWTARQPSR